MPTPPSTIDDLVGLIVRSGLLDPGRLDDYLSPLRLAATVPDSPATLADALVRDGLLTHYQAQQLLTGRWRNFFLNNKYKVLERLGDGGMASVFLCEHKIMQRCVAIKVLPLLQAGDVAAVARFHREARAVAQLQHPNIAAAYDVDQVKSTHYIVMEYVDGCNLETLVGSRGPLDPSDAAHCIAQAALGLQHAHEAGLVHRDIKPANLIIDRAGTVKILDLGLARFFHEQSGGLTRQREVQFMLGTIDYLAPEQAVDSTDVDIRADIYSLGATFYYLLTGRGPFPAGTLAQRLSQHQIARPRPIRETRPDVPEGLEAVVARMLAKAPADRYQVPAEVAEALTPWTQAPLRPPVLEGLSRLSPAAQNASRSLAVRRVAPGSIGAGPAAGGDAAEESSVARPRARGRRWARWAVSAGLAAGALVAVGAWWVVLGPRAIVARLMPPRDGPRAPGTKVGPRPPSVATAPRGPIGSSPVRAPAPPSGAPAMRSHVTIIDAEGTSRWVIFSSPRVFAVPTWTPDGKDLVLCSERALWRLPVDGGEPEPIRIDPIPGIFDGLVEADHGLSPDGTRLAFTANAIFVVPAAGGRPRRVAERASSVFHGWSPDGKTLVYCAPRDPATFAGFDLYSIPAAGGPETRLTAHPAFDDAPDYAPDGRWIYFSSNRAGGSDIWRIPAEGAGPNDAKAERVTDDDLEDEFPHPSPDGRWLVFLSYPKGSSTLRTDQDVALRIMPLPGEKVEVGAGLREVQRLVGGFGTINSPCWAPDGKRFAYVSTEPATPTKEGSGSR